MKIVKIEAYRLPERELPVEVIMYFEPSAAEEFSAMEVVSLELMAKHKSEVRLVHPHYIDEHRRLEKAQRNKFKFCPYCGKELEVR